jgi:hypothetical protein
MQCIYKKDIMNYWVLEFCKVLFVKYFQCKPTIKCVLYFSFDIKVLKPERPVFFRNCEGISSTRYLMYFLKQGNGAKQNYRFP